MGSLGQLPADFQTNPEMTTLIRQTDSNGRTRVCNSTCHRAARRLCTCICNGRLHGSAISGTLETDYKQVIRELEDQQARLNDANRKLLNLITNVAPPEQRDA